MEMDLSVIIVCYRGWEKLTKCLESLDSFSGNNFSMEVIVVDNNSADGRTDEIEKKFPRFRFIRNKINGGYAYGCNTGASYSGGENLLILNPDTIVEESEIEKLLNALRSNPGYYIISCKQLRGDGKEMKASGSFPGLFRARKGKSKNENSENVTFPDWVSGSVMMMRKEIFEKLKGFDEDFWMYYEDVDICRRTRNSGGEIAFYNNIAVRHDHGGSSRANLVTTSLTKTEVQTSRHLYISKHKSGIEKILMHTIIILDNIVTGLITGLAGLLFFFIPALYVRFLIFLRLTGYYIHSMYMRIWMSRRSVNYRRLIQD